MRAELNEIEISGQKYVTLERASELTGYDREYLRRLVAANPQKIQGMLVGGTWFVTIESIEEYKNAKPQRKPHGT